MLLAGIGFMGALQDALSGFYVTGGARLTEALLATAGIIAGVSGGLTLAELFGVEVGRLDPGAAGLEGVSMMALGGAICAAAFAFASYAPGPASSSRSRLIAAVAMVISQSLALQHGSAAPGRPALAAFFVGLVSYTVAGRLRVPPLVVVVSAVVPMLPGLSIYRGLVAAGRGRRGLDLRRPAGHDDRRLGGDRAGVRRDPRGVRRPAAQARGAAGSRPGSPARAWSGPLRTRTGRTAAASGSASGPVRRRSRPRSEPQRSASSSSQAAALPSYGASPADHRRAAPGRTTPSPAATTSSG